MLKLHHIVLYRRTLYFRDRTLSDATLLPLFDREGLVRKLLVLDFAGGRAHSFDWEGGLFGVNFWQSRFEIRESLDFGETIQDWEGFGMRELWHFDPQRSLRTGAFRNQAVAKLQDNNFVEHVDDIDAGMLLERDLSRVCQLAGRAFLHRSPLSLPPLAARLEVKTVEPQHARKVWRMKAFG